MRTARLLAGIVGLLLISSRPAEAFSITFLEPPPGPEIAVSTDLPGATVTTGPDLATVNATVPGVLGGRTSLAIGLLDPGNSLLLDLVTVSVDQAIAGSIGIAASYQSAALPLLAAPAGALTESTFETGLRQNVLSLVLPLLENGPLDLDVSAREEVEPGVLQNVPEPGTLLLLGSIMAWLGAVALRRRTQDLSGPTDRAHSAAGILRHPR